MSLCEEYYKFEDLWLAPYAQHTKNTKGREFPETEHPTRTHYQRDRDRIIHSRAFRRMEYKTQVFIVHEGDHYRTRLTHTMEVATISRSMARALKLNEDLAEAIALAHDVGHPPFGHSGEKALHELMEEHGGFEHNSQSLRIVEELETKYPDFHGLNLTWEVREGIAKHKGTYDKPLLKSFNPKKKATLEAQIVNIADEIAYNTHDLDDGLESGLITYDNLKNISVWHDSYSEISKKHIKTNNEVKRYFTIRSLIDRQVTNVIHTTEENLQRYNIKTLEDVRNAPSEIVSFSLELLKENNLLKDFLYNNLYTHYQVNRMNHRSYMVVKDLFKTYINNPKLLSPSTRAKLKQYPLERVICDYIAGMTDRFAFQEHKKLCDLWEKI
jgi:dGTPase